MESAETIVVSLTDPTGATLGERTACEITIRDTTPDVTQTPEPTEQPGPTSTPDSYPDSHSYTYPWAAACVAFNCFLKR